MSYSKFSNIYIILQWSIVWWVWTVVIVVGCITFCFYCKSCRPTYSFFTTKDNSLELAFAHIQVKKFWMTDKERRVHSSSDSLFLVLTPLFYIQKALVQLTQKTACHRMEQGGWSQCWTALLLSSHFNLIMFESKLCFTQVLKHRFLLNHISVGDYITRDQWLFGLISPKNRYNCNPCRLTVS